MRVGNGYDVHRLVENLPLIIGGVEIDWTQGLYGHSDADVLLHAICDACLGAIAKGDIGKHFPSEESAYRDADSRYFLRHIQGILEQEGWQVSNLDCTIVAERPKMRDHIPQMKENIALDLDISPSQVNIKATTTEGLCFCGREEGIAAYAIVLINQ